MQQEALRQLRKAPGFTTTAVITLAFYANKQLLEHLLAGIQNALGDLKADDKPSAAEGK